MGSCCQKSANHKLSRNSIFFFKNRKLRFFKKVSVSYVYLRSLLFPILDWLCFVFDLQDDKSKARASVIFSMHFCGFFPRIQSHHAG